MNRDTSAWTLKTLHEYRKSDSINDDVPFQRRNVWRKKSKSLLIDSILQDIAIPELTFWTENDGGVYNTIDGKQRGGTISEFFDDKFSVRQENRYRLFSQLNPSMRRRIERYKINVIVYTDCTLKQATEYFSRTNAGVPLNSTEKRHGMFGPVRDLCYELSLSHAADGVKQKTLFDDLPFTGKRGEYEKLTAQCFLMERDIESVRRSKFPDIKAGDLNRAYRRQTEQDPTGEVAQRLTHNLGIISDALKGTREAAMLTKSMFVDLYVLTSIEFEGTEDADAEFAERLRQFIVWVEANKEAKAMTADGLSYRRLQASESDKGPTIKARQALLRKNFEKFVPIAETDTVGAA